MESKKRSKKNAKQLAKKAPEEKKRFSAQVNCTCKKKCAERIDVIAQKDIFDIYHSLSKWSKKTQFLRSITKREVVKESFNPRINLKSRDHFSSFYLYDASGKTQRVCLSFVTKLLQMHRSKIFRAVSSIYTNPNAIDRRGKTPTRKTSAADIEFIKDFIQTFPCYESKVNPTPSDIKYFHPRLTLIAIYKLYENNCSFKQKVAVSKTVFSRVLKKNFRYLQVYKPENRKCHICEYVSEHKKKKVFSPEVNESVQKIEDEHFSVLRDMKNQLKQYSQDPVVGCEVLNFELQRPLELPFLSTDESYDMRQLWFDNLCVFDEVRRKAYMYVWDETVAKRGPEEIASCLIKHIKSEIPKTTKKVILYSDVTNLYRNMRISLMLRKCFDYMNNELETIEQRFFFPGHSVNDCNTCFGYIERKIKTNTEVLLPEDWINLISSAKNTEPKFTVTQMTKNDFYSVKPIIDKLNLNERTSADGKELHWSNIRSIIFNRSEPLIMRVNYFTDGDETVCLLNDDNLEQFRSTKFIYSSMGGNAIPKSKFDDLLKTMNKFSAQNQAFYSSIRSDDSLPDADFVLASYDL